MSNNVIWRLQLYSYKGKYGCASHEVDVAVNNGSLDIVHAERLKSTCQTADGETVDCFSGIYGVNTSRLSCEDGKIIEHNRYETETLPDVFRTKRIQDKDFPDNKHYFFDKYDIFMEGDWTVCCQQRDGRNMIWKKNVRHYLYTEIECKDGMLYFGTQGNGGLFYALSIADGDTVFALHNNGFHPEFFWVNEKLLIDDPKGSWNLVDPKTGELIASAFSGDIKCRNGNDFVVLCERYNRSTRLYDGELLYVRL